MNYHVASYCIPVILDAPGYSEVILPAPNVIQQIDRVRWTVFNTMWLPHKRPHSLVRFVHAFKRHIIIGFEPLAYWRRPYMNIVVDDLALGSSATIPLCVGAMHDIIDLGEMECKDGDWTKKFKRVGTKYRLRLR